MSNYPTFIPYLSVIDAAAAIEFYKAAFEAEERLRLVAPDSGKIGHCEFTIRGQLMMVCEEFPAMSKSPATLGGVSATFVLTVPNADAAFDRAIAAGAIAIRPPQDQFYGFRSGSVRDPFGHEWMLQHEIEKLTPAALQKRWDEMVGSGNESPAA